MPNPPLETIPVAAVQAVVALCGAVILLLLDNWLRRRSVRDTALLWISISLLSWSVAGLLEVAAKRFNWTVNHPWISHPKYVLSPVSSVLFALTAFRLYRVRDLVEREHLRSWCSVIVWTIVIVSGTALALNVRNADSSLARYIDAVGSFMALSVIGAGLIYSFYSYGNQLLVGLTAVTFTLLIARQFISAASPDAPDPLAPLWIASTTMEVMLFIALAVAWGLSETARERIVGGGIQVNAVALFFDLRGSTAWSSRAIDGNYAHVRTTMDELRMWAWEKALSTIKGSPAMVKFLGDGYMFVWECPQRKGEVAKSITSVTALGVSLATEYQVWASSNEKLCWEVPAALGVGIDFGPAIRLNFENASKDYLGAPINMAAKLQNLARPSGGVVVLESLWKRLDPDEGLAGRFTTSGMVSIGGDRALHVRATEGVDLQDCVIRVNQLRMLGSN